LTYRQNCQDCQNQIAKIAAIAAPFEEIAKGRIGFQLWHFGNFRNQRAHRYFFLAASSQVSMSASDGPPRAR
jgi:hypothetical protein